MFDRAARHHAPHHHGIPRGHHRDAMIDPRAARSLREWLDPFRSHRPAVRRGDVRPLILRALRDRPMHGYQVIQELEDESGGRWRPSAGSVYPTLQQLEDEGLVRSEEVDGRRTYTLTDDGRSAADEAAPGPWTAERDQRNDADLRRLAIALVATAAQVQRDGSTAARGEVRRILVDARRSIYRVLADDLGEADGEDDPMDDGGRE
ncbi:MAG TPA: PadR family transcriptional regulator [Candidatus Limnocylindrales bacterium]